MARDDAAAELERLRAEVERLREVHRHLREERERVRRESAEEIERLQASLREAAGRAGARDDQLERQAAAVAERERSAAERERGLAEREQELANGMRRLQQLAAGLESEQRHLEGERARLERESERLAEWERQARLGAAGVPTPTTFDEGLRRLGGGRRAPGVGAQGSW
jgi:hypothetical protein